MRIRSRILIRISIPIGIRVCVGTRILITICIFLFQLFVVHEYDIYIYIHTLYATAGL